ncbi:MAG TPA: cytochrome c oxidase assembly protein [Gaiellaceae bacterium]|nr:cytochrome c oxidase assembly protein [Gaiellaceae bacterium]
MDPYAWSWNPEALVLVPAAALAYGAALRRYPAPAWRVACFAAALALLLAVTITPLETLALRYLLTVHLLQNVVLAEWAPLLAVLGLPPALAAALARPRPLRILLHPGVALPLWLANYMLWHLPWLYDAALERPHTLLHLEHALYVVTGVAMWWGVVQDAPHRLGAGARAAVVFAAFVLGSPIGLVLALVPEPIYAFYVEAPRRLWGLDPLQDQQLAGLLMAAEQALVFFAVFAYWFFRFLGEEERSADAPWRAGRADDSPADYPAGGRP